MKVTFLLDKYKCGSNLGIYYHDEPGILNDLREIIDLSESEYPEKWVETEDGTAYHKTRMTEDEFFGEGKEHQLEPGHMFIYDGQVFAIDSPDRLILALSETGALAIKRFITNILEPELELQRGNSEYTTSDVQVTELTKLPDELSEEQVFSISYYKEKIWREKTNFPKIFQVVFKSSYSFIPIKLWFKNNHVYYSDELDSDIIEFVVQEFLCWSWKNKLENMIEEKKSEN